MDSEVNCSRPPNMNRRPYDAGFVLDGMKEPVFQPRENEQSEWTELPPVVVLRFRKACGVAK